MSSNEEIKEMVKEKYGQIARQASEQKAGTGCCCGSAPYTLDYSIMSDDYKGIEGYFDDADLGLGCGLPTEYAQIRKGDTVLDLGSGAGNDVFIARRYAGEAGKVIGIDMTQDMIDKANGNNAKLKFENVEFRLGEIEALPVEDDSVDVVISNCVLNLVPDKEKAFSEIQRVLKSGGRFCVSDIVLNAELHPNLRSAAAMYAGCIAGALMKDDYINIINKAGFGKVEIVKEKNITVPSSLLMNYIDLEEIEEFKKHSNPIVSITVIGVKK